VADRYLTDRTQRRTLAGAQHNPAAWTVGAARCFSQRRQALNSLRLLGIGSTLPSLMIKRTPSKPGRCWSEVSFRWSARNELAGWWRLICWWLLPIDGDGRRRHTSNRHQFLCSVPEQEVLGPHPPTPATKTLRADSRAVTCCPEDGGCRSEGGWFSLKSESPRQSPYTNGLILTKLYNGVVRLCRRVQETCRFLRGPSLSRSARPG